MGSKGGGNHFLKITNTTQQLIFLKFNAKNTTFKANLFCTSSYCKYSKPFQSPFLVVPPPNPHEHQPQLCVSQSVMLLLSVS